MKLRNRLVAAVTGVTVVALALSFVPLYLLIRALEISDLDNALFRQATALAQHLPGTYYAGHPLDEGHADVPESIDPTPRYTAIYGPDTVLETASESFAGQAPGTLAALGLRHALPWDGVAVDLELGEARLRGVVMPTGDQGEALLYAVSKSTVEDDTTTLFELLLLIFVCAAGATALIARWLGERLARDVHSVAHVARLVAEGDLAARVGDPRVMGADETRSLATDLDHMISRLDEVVSSQRRFISHAAHELRSPLASLRGELQLALRRDRDVDEYRAALREMLSSVDALIALAEDLLRLARAQGGAPATRGRARVADVVREAVRMARGHLDDRGVTIAVPPAIDEFPVEVRGGAADLTRALRNLIDNAVVHSPPGGEVRVEVVVVEGGVELAVVDQGPGIPVEDQPHIFTPFFRGAGGENHEGAGLGLAIARGLTEGSGGRLALDTRHTGGARMVLHLAFAESVPPV
ncbi:HAMP domain-containing sensor histidine kinase [Nannocystis pusilla]|uniref:histidine kinase n=1 Tax=Nannocystis pusilla TaxID=889268 RepID=A0A9X3ENN3_9BACT|nr:HAMP domain-containing sensor histidine kinase [Nannocystis pusilla]MCY1006495.1 HAMP domain-containing sensor histidine kinase [Nannocystis pusilla]